MTKHNEKPSERLEQTRHRVGNDAGASSRNEVVRWKHMLSSLPSVRMDKVMHVRRQLRAQRYEEAAKIDATVDRIVDEAFLLGA